jgi:hypothetical protein
MRLLKQWTFLGLAFGTAWAFADVGWPALWVTASAAQAVERFWYVVLVSLAIEAAFLRYFAKLSWKSSCSASIVANAFSAFFGALATVPLLATDLGVMWSTAGLKFLGDYGVHLAFGLSVVLMLALTTLIERFIVHRFWRVPKRQALICMVWANIVTYALAVALCLETFGVL